MKKKLKFKYNPFDKKKDTKKVKVKPKTKTTKTNTKKTTSKNKAKTTTFSKVLSVLLIVGIIGITAGLVLALFVILTAPEFNTDLLYEKEATTIYDVNGNELVRVGENNTELVSYEELPQVLIDAIVATEDSRFFQHSGLDAPRLVMATFGQLLGNSDAGGASTLSMQVVKNTYTTNIATGIEGVLRKVTDIYMSIFKLESTYTKEEIIEFYVNSQWLGNDNNVNYTGITGVEQASWYYFGKSVSEISLAEATILAGMFQNPVAHNPYDYPESTRARQEIVLTLMVRHGYITELEKETVLEIPVESLLVEHETTSNNYLQDVIDYILAETEEKTGLNPFYTPMDIYSTIDPEIQEVMEGLESGELYEYPEKYGPLQFGLAITSIEDGSIVGLSGGLDYEPKGTNRALVERQPGSTAKPIFDYAPHIEYLNSSTGTIFLDEAISYTNGPSIVNWDNKYNGPMTMRDALADSRNATALRAFKDVAAVDLDLIGDFATSLGIDYGPGPYESASLGGFDGTSPLDMSAAYAAFGRGGYYIEPYIVSKVHILENDEIQEFKYTSVKVMSDSTAYMVTDMLVTAGNNGVGGFTVSGTTLAAKTGSTTIDSDAAKALGIPTWTVPDGWVNTYSPEYSMSLWTGYDKLTEDDYLSLAQSTASKHGITKAIGKQIFSTNQRFSQPSSVTRVDIEFGTIPPQLPSEFTPENMIISELFKSGTEPTDISTRYMKLDSVTNLSSEVIGNTINLTWDEIDTPDTLNDELLIDHFNEYYEDFAAKYYEERINYNNTTIGTVIYEVYLNNNGTETLISTSAQNSYSHVITTPGVDYDFIIRTSYSIYTINKSDPVSIKVQTENNIDPEPDPDPNPDPDPETEDPVEP